MSTKLKQKNKSIKPKSVGAPKKEIDLLSKGWKDKILKLYEEGASNVEVKALIYKWLGSFSNDLWTRWMNESPQFSETIKKGLLLSEAWWEKEGRSNLKSKEFSPVLWYMNMKNRFGWKDKHEFEENKFCYDMNKMLSDPKAEPYLLRIASGENFRTVIIEYEQFINSGAGRSSGESNT